MSILESLRTSIAGSEKKPEVKMAPAAEKVPAISPYLALEKQKQFKREAAVFLAQSEVPFRLEKGGTLGTWEEVGNKAWQLLLRGDIGAIKRNIFLENLSAVREKLKSESFKNERYPKFATNNDPDENKRQAALAVGVANELIDAIKKDLGIKSN
jgi:hypothetical protein